MGEDGNIDSSKLPAGAMIDGDGNYVMVKPDKVAWNKFQEKAKQSAAAQEEEARGSRELQQRGLECPIDKRLFVEPTKTPCCQTTYCNECITNALLDDDLRCPNCGKEGVLIDNLQSDAEMISKIRSYETEKTVAKKSQADENVIASDLAAKEPNTKRQSKSPTPEKATNKDEPITAQKSPPQSPSEPQSKKRKAETELDNNRKSPASRAPSLPKESETKDEKPEIKPETLLQKEPPRAPKAMTNQGFMDPANMMNSNNSMGFTAGMPTSMGPMMGMNPFMWDPMAMFNTMGGMNPMFGNTFPMPNMNGMPQITFKTGTFRTSLIVRSMLQDQILKRVHTSDPQ
jgi:protein MPE1